MTRIQATFAAVGLSAVTALVPAAFAAQDGPSQQIVITATRPALAAAQAVIEQGHLDATYEMSTGRKMSARLVGEAVRIGYGRRLPVLLRHDGQGQFVSGDGQWSLQFELDDQGEPQQVRLTMPSDRA